MSNENNILEMPKNSQEPALPLLAGFISCLDRARVLKASNYTTSGAEAVIEFSGRRILMNLRDLGAISPGKGTA